MKVPLSWLQTFFSIPLSSKEIAETLTLLGIEVEKIEETTLPFQGVVVGKVIAVKPHPNADKLRVATVTDGKEEVQVVCGAANCREGITVAFARLGASLTDPEGKSWKIKKSKIREVESCGMLCAATELQLADHDEGIMELPETALLGSDLSTLYSDPVFEISLTPNLGHCLSILGIARELAAALNSKVIMPKFNLREEGSHAFQVSVKDQTLCPRYSCRLVKGVCVGPSPEWLVKKLEASGLKSINTVVDVGNYVMLELGQPLHMFDAATISGQKIRVEPLLESIEFTTLDQVKRQLPFQTLMILDGEKPLAIAGIMGGASSAVTEATKDVLIESASFAPAAIRKISRALDLKTDASYRFDRGTDSGAVTFALDRAAFLLQEIAGGKPAQNPIDLKSAALQPKILTCRTERVNEILGTELSQNEIVSCLQRLEMDVRVEQDLLYVTVPSYRNDISLEIDLIEEVARIFGYNNLPKQAPKHLTSQLLDAPIYTFEKSVRTRLLEEGLQECITCDLISPELAKLALEKGLDQNACIQVLNPSSVDQSCLRTSLLPGLLQVVQTNAQVQVKEIRAFELGRIHFKEGKDFKEHSCVGIILSGEALPSTWDHKSKPVDFYDLKGIVENLLYSCGISKAQFEPCHLHSLHPWRQAKIKLGPMVLGVLGEVHPLILEKLDLKERVFFAELSLHDLFPLKKKEKKARELTAFPGSERDCTLFLKEALPMSQVFQAIESHKNPLLESFFLLDLYKSDRIGKDRKNATFRFFYRDKEKTISKEAVEKEHDKLIEAVKEKLKDSLEDAPL